MTGVYLKDFLRKQNVPQSDVAKKLGMSTQSFYQMLQSNDVKSSLVERIASILHVTMGEIYGEAKEQSAVATGNGIAVTGNNNVAGNVIANDTTSDINILQERNALLQQILQEKERLIQVLIKQSN